jgi:uncharacterized protein
MSAMVLVYADIRIQKGVVTNMKCLDCNREMMNYEAHTIARKLSYDVCDSCGGLWLDKSELDKMAFHLAGDIEYCSQEGVENGQSAKTCPRCNVNLHTVKFLGVEAIVDRCENCGGFWLDGGQLDKIDKDLARIMPVFGKRFTEFLTNTHLPHWYKRIKRDSAATDCHVPVLPFREARLLGKSSHPCPACHQVLDIYNAYGIKIENCSVCHGLWLQKGELRILKDKVDPGSWRNLRWMNDEVEAIEKTSAIISNRACPECKGSPLLSTHFANSKIVIDWCRTCQGTWLDFEEFKAIVEYLRDELDHLTSKEMEKKVITEVKNIWSDNSESKISEILDTKAAISALANISIFEHPALFGLLINVSRTVR